MKPNVLLTGRHWIGKRGGAILRAHKKDFGTIPYFLEIANVGEAYLIFEKISVLPKVFSDIQQAYQIENTFESVFCNSKNF